MIFIIIIYFTNYKTLFNYCFVIYGFQKQVMSNNLN